MQKIVFIGLIILVISCGGDSKKSEVNSLTFWHFWSEPNQKIVLDSLIKEFTLQTGISVETTELSWNDGKTKLLAAFNSKTAPDVLELGSDWVAQFSSSEVLAEQKKDLENFLEWSKKPCYWNSKIYARPWIVDSRVIFYNKEILDKFQFDPANSFQEIYDQSLEITESSKGELYGFGVNSSDPNRLYKKALIFLWSNGGNVLSNGESTLNSQSNIEALSLYGKFQNAGLLATQKELDDTFVDGKIAYTISGGWLLEKISKEAPDLKFGVMQIPNFNNNKGVSFAGGEYLSINKFSEKKQLSQKFINFLTNGKNTIEFCKKVVEAGFPADKNFYKDKSYESKEYRKVISKQLENAKMTPVHPKWLEIQDELEQAFERVLFENISPNKSLETAQNKIKNIIHE